MSLREVANAFLTELYAGYLNYCRQCAASDSKIGKTIYFYKTKRPRFPPRPFVTKYGLLDFVGQEFLLVFVMAVEEFVGLFIRELASRVVVDKFFSGEMDWDAAQ